MNRTIEKYRQLTAFQVFALIALWNLALLGLTASVSPAL